MTSRLIGSGQPNPTSRRSPGQKACWILKTVTCWGPQPHYSPTRDSAHGKRAGSEGDRRQREKYYIKKSFEAGRESRFQARSKGQEILEEGGGGGPSTSSRRDHE